MRDVDSETRSSRMSFDIFYIKAVIPQMDGKG